MFKTAARFMRAFWWSIGIMTVVLGLVFYRKAQVADSQGVVGMEKSAGVVPVRIVRTKSGFQLQRGGRQFFIKGGAGLQHYAELKAAGANSVRLWSADYADDRLNEAQREGLTVMLGLWMNHASKKFDYYDREQVQQQQERIRQQVLRYRHHPALLAWDVGNEVNISTSSPQMFRSLNEVAKMIHTLDPYHPVTTSLTNGTDAFRRVRKMCPDLDFISVNTFGELPTLAGRLQENNWDKPYVVTEFGARGYWESPKRQWGAAAEQSSTEKAAFTRERYQQAILGHPDKCLGAYVFYWGSKFEYTTTWYSLFAPTGEKTATVDVMQELWSNRKPANLAPRIEQLAFANYVLDPQQSLRPGAEYLAKLTVIDPENDSLRFEWALTPDLPIAKTTSTPPEAIAASIRTVGLGAVMVRTPTKPGAYRLAVSVYDGKGSVATANVPIFVQ